MSTVVLFLYSKYVPQVKPYLDIIEKLEYIQTLCVDNEQIRKVIAESSLLSVKKVPCFIVINKDQSVFQYTNIGPFLKKLIEANAPKQPEKIEKSPIQNVVEIPQQTHKQVQQHNFEKEDLAMSSNKSFPTNSNPHQKEQHLEAKKSNKTNIGEIINYQKEKNEKLRPDASSSSSQSSIQKGIGHDDMGRSSLREAKKELSVIEDIEEEETSGLINFGNNPTSNNGEKKDKRISDIKSLVSEMADQREEQLKKIKQS